MKRIKASKTELQCEGRKADVTDYDVLIDETTEITRPDGSLLCLVLKNSISPVALNTCWSGLKGIHLKTNNRITATGEGMVKKNRQTVSPIAVDSGMVGFFERTPRFPYCRACAWNLKNPEAWSKLFPMAKEVDDLFKKHASDRYKNQMRVAQKSHPDFLIPGTFFSTLTVNKNFRTAYHRDAGNLPDGISCMTVIRKGKWSGANLVFPEYRVGVKLDSHDMIIFDPHELHGNTPLIKLSKDAVRCSIVYYFRDKIQHCRSAKEELSIAKNRKAGQKMFEVKP